MNQAKSAHLRLPLILLLFSLLIKITLILTYFSNYWYDELIVTTISQQPLHQLLDTVKAEPHPPGYYLFLKILPITNSQLTKLCITLISYSITLLALAHSLKQKLLSKYKLSLGISLFISSFSFMLITSDAKQDSLSLPLLLLLLSILVPEITNRKPKVGKIILANLIINLLLTIGYVNYLWSMLLFTPVCIYKKSKPYFLSLAYQFLVFTVFFKLYLHEQIEINSQRFSWIHGYYNSLLEALSYHLTGLPIYNIQTDLITITALFLIIYFTTNILLQKNNRFAQLTLLYLLSLTAVAYSGNMFVRLRYVVFPFFLVSIVIGWSLSTPKLKKLAYPLTILLFIYTISGYFINIKQRKAFLSEVDNIIKEQTAGNETLGLITDKEIFPFAFYFHYTQRNLISPVNPCDPNATKPDTILRQHLTISNCFTDASEQEISQKFQKIPIRNYLYLHENPPIPQQTGPHNLLTQVLSNNCTLEKTYNITPITSAYIYKNCNFKKE